MSILTSLQDAFASTKGPYSRYVERYTRRFCIDAARRAKTKEQKRIWLSSAISADEVIAALAGLDKKRPLGSLANWRIRPGTRSKSYLQALKIYLSGLLILYGSRKDELLAWLGMAERDFMEAWQKVFGYEKEDKDLFDNYLLPSFRERGIDGLADTVGHLIRDILFQPDCPFGKEERDSLQGLMLSDLIAVTRHIDGDGGKPAEAGKG